MIPVRISRESTIRTATLFEHLTIAKSEKQQRQIEADEKVSGEGKNKAKTLAVEVEIARQSE